MASFNIRVNSVAPGVINTEMNNVLDSEDKEVLKSILDDEMWVDGAIQITVMDTSKVHLILNVQE